MSKDQTLPDTPSVTSSPVLGAGAAHSNSQGGLQLGLFGPAVSHASRSATPEAAGENPTSDTSGLSSSVSSRSANLQLSLENRLRQDLDVNGCPEYGLVWKQWGMESGLPICALRASGHRISDSGSTGWPSPMAGTPANDRYNEAGNTDFSRKVVALVTGWPTPQAADGGKIGSKPNFGQVGLSNHPALHGYPEREPMQKSREGDGQTTNLSGWNSPRATDGSNGGPNQSGGALSNDVAGWTTPQAMEPDARERPSRAATGRTTEYLGRQVHGLIASGSPSETGSKGVLNPALPLWLQGFPSDWLMVAPVKMSRVSS